MKEITDIVKCGKDKYSIYLDNMFYCFLKSETIVKNNIKKGIYISEEDINLAQFENEKITAFDKAIKYLSSIKSEKQVKDYLYSKGYTSKTINYVLDKLKEYNYIDDELFAKTYIQNYSLKKGIRLLKFELESKGINREIINNALENVDDNDETIKYLAEKYLTGKTKDRKTMQKLANHLFSKGFSFDKINKIIKQIYNFSEEENESWN